MHNAIVTSMVMLAFAAPAFAAEQPGGAFDWDQWRRLPVQAAGRRKPLDSLAWETLRTIANRTRFTDPQRNQQLGATALYLAMLFDWQGGQQPADPHGMAMLGSQMNYFQGHLPDKWDRADLIRVDFLALREALGIEKDQKYVSPLQLSQAKIRDPNDGEEMPFATWAARLGRRGQKGLTTFEKKGSELANKLWVYQQHRMGQRLEVIPVRGSEDQQWISIAYLLRTDFNDQTDPTGGIRKIKEQFQKARAAYRSNSPEAFNQASSAFIAGLREIGPQLGDYPPQATIDLEVAYNRWVPFRFAWVFTLITFLCVLVSMGSRWKPFYYAGLASFVAGLLAMIVGFGMRIAISGRAPVTDMYESVVYLGLGVAALGLVLELISRKQYILTAAAAVTTVALILADNCPAVLDPSFRPLQPVLRSNFWLVTHVLSITLSYAAFALALGIGNITLGFFLLGSKRRDVITAQSKFTYRSLQVGVLLLAIGTILGAVWADYAWGRFWGWDPKEVWALIALLGYLAVLHARYAGWVRSRGLAALSVICFALVVMAWYGVNFVLGAGLHSYGFGGGGQMYVYATVGLQLLYVAVAVVVSSGREVFARPTDAPPPEEAGAGA